MLDDKTRDIIERIERLESAVFKSPQKVKLSGQESGPSGGIAVLISKGFFHSKKSADQVKGELEAMGYIYLRTVIQTALRRLARTGGPLVVITEKNQKVYADRK